MNALIIPIVAALSTQPIPVPQLNFESSCRAASSLRLADNQTFLDCMRQEAAAKKDVANNWDSYSPKARARCSAEVQIGGNPSYVEPFTCLDIDKRLSQRSR